MNIFYLHNDPKVCAEMHNDKHCIKMILEYAQLLSTAHRVLDGVELEGISASGRKRKFWTLGDSRDYTLYKATHINHPSAIWCRQSYANYVWLSKLLTELCREYTYRYGKVHKVEASGLEEELMYPPMNIPPVTVPFTEPTPAMPDEDKVSGDSIASYRNYYINKKTHLAKWSGKYNSRNVPEWFDANLSVS
jgi:hypothetical protein